MNKRGRANSSRTNVEIYPRTRIACEDIIRPEREERLVYLKFVITVGGRVVGKVKRGETRGVGSCETRGPFTASRVSDVEKFFSRDKRVFRMGSKKRRHGGKYCHGGKLESEPYS